MKCPFCGHLEDKVVDSRESKEGDAIRRRRQCLGCQRRFTSYERIDEIPYMAVKKDGRRERFDRQKVLAGVLKACEKRPVSMIQLETIAGRGDGDLRKKDSLDQSRGPKAARPVREHEAEEPRRRAHSIRSQLRPALRYGSPRSSSSALL